MVGKYLDVLIGFVARILYYIDKYKLSFDKAFQYTLRDYKEKVKSYSLKRFYDVAWNVVLSYYKLRFLEERIFGAHKGYKRLVTLWVVFLGEQLLGEVSGYNRLKRKFTRNIPKRIDLEEELSRLDTIERLAIELSYPKWFVELLSKYMDLSGLKKMLESMNKKFYWIRVNTLKIDVDKAIKLLEAEDIVVEPDKNLWYMLKVIDYKKPLYQLQLLQQGYIVAQDKASAMVVEALAPQPGDKILDACAAPGIKASLIMQLTENRAELVLVDISRDRTYNMVKLLRKYGVDTSKVEVVIADSTKPTINRRLDKALLDVPCSSSGALPRDPSIRIHLEDVEWVKRFPYLQRMLLEANIPFADEIVYATCSLIPWEGEEVIEYIMKTCRNVDLAKPDIPGVSGYKGYDVSSRVVRFFPHMHRTEGFFLAKIISYSTS